MFKNALVSVSDKTGLENFLRPFADQGMRIVSSGGTAQFLIDKGFKVTKVSEQTQFPEVMNGRVKTLHPNIHMALLYRQNIDEDMQILEKHGLEPFDLVVVNLYPFKEALAQGKSDSEMIEFIDIGGPTLLRASAKNFESITVVCDPADYSWVGSKKQTDSADRRKLAAKVFNHVSDYDNRIAGYLDSKNSEKSFAGTMHSSLRYGENPQQKAQWFKSASNGWHQAQILQGKELSYNNLLDLESAVQTLRLFAKPTAVAVKHNNPCGVASDTTIELAVEKALTADPVSVFGGIVAMNKPLTLKTAQLLNSVFLECVVAPSITEDAKKVLQEKKNLRVLVWEEMLAALDNSSEQFRSINGGFLVQDQDSVQNDMNEWKTVSGELSDKEMQGLQFAWNVCAALKSNAIAVTSGTQSLGLGMGQVNRVDAVKQAFERAEQFHGQETQKYLASDAFFPFPDSVELAAQNGVVAIVQPGGSIKDEAVIAKARELKIPMVFTGRRHFRH